VVYPPTGSGLKEKRSATHLHSSNWYDTLSFYITLDSDGWLGSRVVSVLDSGAEGPGLDRSRDAVG